MAPRGAAGSRLAIARSALILGGTGQIGRALTTRFLAAGWDVAVAARTQPPATTDVRFFPLDRHDDDALRAAVGGGVDVLVDVIPFTADDGRQLASLGDQVGSVVAISSAGVYEDGAGRSLDTQATAFPEFPVPVTERQPTVPPGDDTYATRKIAMERVLLESELRTTIVRPCAIHGPGGTSPPRELYFVKRALDGRKVVLLSHRGATRFHTTSVVNLAELVWLAAERPANRIVNCGDPNPPTVLEIARAHAAALDVEWAEVLLAGQPEGGVGETPWSGPSSLVLDMADAEIELRYRPVTSYAAALPQTIEWLLEARPEPASWPGEAFDYEREDRFLAALTER